MKSKDIAKLAGVSRSTVSRVVNNYSNVPDETKKKVQKIIDEYGYTPNESARILAGKASKTIGVFIMEVHSRSKKAIVKTSGYFSEFIAGMIDEADRYDYNVLVSIINNEKEFNSIRALFANKSISAGVFIGEEEGVSEISDLVKKGYNIGLIDQEPKKDAIVVNSADFEGAYKGIQYLIDSGHKRIMHLCGDLKKHSGRERKKGYEKALIDNGIDIYDEYFLYGDFTEESGFELIKEKFSNCQKRPTAIFAASDEMAIGAMEAFRKMGINIPEDISIIGFNNIEISKYTSPKLSTLNTSIEKMSAVMISNLVKLIDKKEDVKYINTIEASIINRESVKEK
ncbi:MAG: LacI family DNA-binding transcriptional regulator [Fusobacteriota bacterium]